MGACALQMICTSFLQALPLLFRCASCGWGDISLCVPGGDGSWEVEWAPVPCAYPAAADAFVYDMGAANAWWLKFAIANAR